MFCLRTMACGDLIAAMDARGSVLTCCTQVLDQQLQRAPLLGPEQLHGQRVGRLLLRQEPRLQQRPPVALEGELLGLRVAAEAPDELVGDAELRGGVRQQRRRRRRRHGGELIGQVLGLEERGSAGPGAVEHEGRELPPDRAQGGVGLRRRSSRRTQRRDRGQIGVAFGHRLWRGEEAGSGGTHPVYAPGTLSCEGARLIFAGNS